MTGWEFTRLLVRRLLTDARDVLGLLFMFGMVILFFVVIS